MPFEPREDLIAVCFETRAPEDVRFYSGARGKAYPVTRDSAADAILDQALPDPVLDRIERDGIDFQEFQQH